MNTDLRFVASSLTVPHCVYKMSDHTGSGVIKGRISNRQWQCKYSRKGVKRNRFITYVMTPEEFSRMLIFRLVIKRCLNSSSPTFPLLHGAHGADFVQDAF